MTEEHIRTGARGRILEVVINRPEKLNALTMAMIRSIAAAVDEFRDRSDLRVMLIRGEGPYFSAGLDLVTNDGPTMPESLSASRTWMRREMGGGLQRLFEEMERIEKPIVVANHAMCLGGGLELSLSCDFRLASASAGYWLPEMQFGMLPLSNGVARLTRVCGGHWARWMAVANEKVDAQRALIMGLVHDVYPDETFEDQVYAFCEKLAGYPEEAVAAGKLAIEMAQFLGGDQARQLERLTFSSLMHDPRQKAMSEAIKKRLGE